MQFKLGPLSESFETAKFRSLTNNYLLYAFFLVTKADEKLLPDLTKHFEELHYLTDKFILIFAPIMPYSSSDNGLREGEVFRFFSSGAYFDSGLREEERHNEVSQQIQEYLSSLTRESLSFARFCGIEVKELPCICFFSSLEKPEDYLTWSLKGQTASEVVKDFREIISALDKQFSESLRLKEQLSDIRYDMRKNGQRMPKLESQHEKSIKEIFRRIDKWKTEYAKECELYEYDTKRKRKQRKKLKSAESDLPIFLAQQERELAELNADVIKVNNKLVGEFEKVQSRLEGFDLPSPISVIQNLDRKRSTRWFLSKLNESVPILNLGLSGAKSIFGL